MTEVQSPGSTRRGHTAGLILIGIAIVALIIGILSLFGGGGSDNAGPSSRPPAPPNSNTTGPSGGQSAGSQPPSSGSASGQPPASTTGSAPATGPATTTTKAQPPAPPPPPPNPRTVPVRVYNNGTITGLAKQAAGDFRADGWNVVEIANYNKGIIPTSTAYFRPGTEEEAAARALGAKFDLKVAPRFDGIVGASPGVIVIITNDYGGK